MNVLRRVSATLHRSGGLPPLGVWACADRASTRPTAPGVGALPVLLIFRSGCKLQERLQSDRMARSSPGARPRGVEAVLEELQSGALTDAEALGRRDTAEVRLRMLEEAIHKGRCVVPAAARPDPPHAAG